MSKLLKLKAFLTLKEATKYLSNSMEEPVSLADIYRLVLDHHLTMSVKLNSHAYAKGGHGCIPQCTDLNSFQVDNKIFVLSGILDLAMIGSEVHEINKLYQHEVDEPKPVDESINSFCLKKGDLIYQLQKSLSIDDLQENPEALGVWINSLLNTKGLSVDDVFNSGDHTMYDLLSDAELDDFMKLNMAIMGIGDVHTDEQIALDELSYQFVIRVSEITRFVQSLEDTLLEDKSFTTNEKNSLLVLLAALCKEAGVDWNKRGIATSLVAMTDLIGAPISDDTIRKMLKQIDPAIDSRSK